MRVCSQVCMAKDNPFGLTRGPGGVNDLGKITGGSEGEAAFRWLRAFTKVGKAVGVPALTALVNVLCSSRYDQHLQGCD